MQRNLCPGSQPDRTPVAIRHFITKLVITDEAKRIDNAIGTPGQHLDRHTGPRRRRADRQRLNIRRDPPRPAGQLLME
jgi:hypothetical protein